jgi:Protein of unknown function (DUF2809)
MQQTRRSRPLWIGVIAAVIVFGLGTRSPDVPFSRLITGYVGDAAWALAVFLGYGLLFPSLSTRKVAVFAAATSFGVELSQFYHPHWLDLVRSTTLGHLVLGSGFDAVDLICYSIGIGAGALLEAVLFRLAQGRTKG